MGFEWIALKNYKRHYVCLDCQKGFKRASQKDMKNPVSSDLSDLMERYYVSHTDEDILDFINASYQKIKAVCPQCRESMIQVSYDFEVPKQRDTKAWKEVRKRLSHRTKPTYDTYIHWHRLQVKQGTGDSAEMKVIRQNMEKLEKAI